MDKYKPINLAPKYVNTQDGGRIYFIPGVPFDHVPDGLGINSEHLNLSLDEAITILGQTLPTTNLTKETIAKAKDLFEHFRGRWADIGTLLKHAIKQNRFDEIVDKLHTGYDQLEIVRIPTMLRMARTDVTAFFMQLYLDLDVGDREEAQQAINFNKKHPPGIHFIPDAEPK